MKVEQPTMTGAVGWAGVLVEDASVVLGNEPSEFWIDLAVPQPVLLPHADRPSCDPKSRPSKSVSTDWNSLLNSSKAGHEADRDRLFELLRVRLVTICQFRLRGWPTEEIEDIVQDSLAIVFEKLSVVSDNPHYFAVAVLDNRIGGVLRQKKRRTMISLNPTGTQSEQDDLQGSDMQLPSDNYDEMLEDLYEADLSEKLLKVLRKLSPLCQATILALLKHRSVADVWEEYQEIGPKLSRSAFDKRLYDCRKKLRELTGGLIA